MGGGGVGSIQMNTFPPRWISCTGGDKIYEKRQYVVWHCVKVYYYY